MSEPIETLRNLITSTSVSLSPVVAWVVFASGVLAKQAERHKGLIEKLRQVMKELDFIGHWAQNEYGPTADSPTWRQPLWSVNDFPSDHIHEFNQIAYTMSVSEPLRGAMAGLETAIERFRTLLKAHREFVAHNNRLDAIAAAISRNVVPAAWFDELHRLNREIHVRGIGTAQDPDGLHSTWTRAKSEVQRAIDNPGNPSHPKRLWFGHVPAGILALIGLGFLLGFVGELLHSLSWPPWPR